MLFIPWESFRQLSLLTLLRDFMPLLEACEVETYPYLSYINLLGSCQHGLVGY
jgi:hypothetical protein